MSYQTLVERRLVPVGKSGNNVIYRCPKCETESNSGHLYVEYTKNKFHCFRCGYAGRDVAKLARDLGLDTDFDYSKLEDKESTLILSETIDSLTSTRRVLEVDYSRDLDILTQYYYNHLRPLSLNARKYLNSRGFTDDIIYRYNVSEGINLYGRDMNILGKSLRGRDYSGRIMIPSLRKEGGISFYVARDYTNLKKVRYLNPPQELAYASEDVWNLDLVSSRSVIICEGVFTAITAGGYKYNAVATYGKSIAKNNSNTSPFLRVSSQGEKLLRRNFDSYYVVYDADASKEMYRVCDYLKYHSKKVYFIRIDPEVYGKNADVNSIGYEEFIKLLSSSREYTSRIDTIVSGIS